MQIKFCKFWHYDMHNWFMFCKFVVGIRHLSIKIIYTSRTGQMIVLYNHINPIIQIKNQITNYAFYIYIPGTYKKYLYYIFCTFGQCAIYSPRGVLSLNWGVVLHFDLIRPLPKTVDAFHSHVNHKIQHLESSLPKHHTPYHTHHPKIVLNPHTIQ